MLQNISVFHFLVFAVLIGFIAAIIYTNIQRTALSKFIVFLVNNQCNSSDKATLLSDIGLNDIEKKIVKSAALKMHGLKRCVCIIKDTTNSSDSLENILEKKTPTDKYYLKECDTEELIKKYSFKTMPAKLIALFVAALIIVSIVVTAAVDWLIGYVTIPKIKNDDEAQTEENVTDSKADSQDETDSDDVTDTPEPVKPSGPRIPI